jgi:hypothetical protein
MKYGKILVLASLEEAIANYRELGLFKEAEEAEATQEWIVNSPYESDWVDLSLDSYCLIRDYL